MDVHRGGAARGPAPAHSRLSWIREDGWLAIAAPALIIVGHLLYGALLPQTALSLTALAAGLLGVCLLRPGLRKALMKLDGLAWPAAMFAAVLLVALWSLTPFVPAGPHPVWAYAEISPGAATIDRSATLLETIKLLGLGCMFVLGLMTGAHDARARRAVNLLLGLAAAFGIWALLMLVTGRQLGGGDRLEASFLTANTAGTVFSASTLLALGPAVSCLSAAPRDRAGALPHLLAILVFIACTIATASRGAFVSLLSALLAFALLLVFSGRMKWSRAALVGLLGICVMTIALGLVGDLLVNRLMGGAHDFAARSVILQVHWRAFLDSPLFGYGLGSFDSVNRMLLNPATFQKIWAVRAAHNVYLDWLEQGGLLAALPMFGCIAMLIITTARKGLRRSRMVPTLFSLLGVDVVFLVHGTTDFALEMLSVAAMWAFLLGTQFALAQGSSSR
jgi:O-antigen ligase